MQVIINCRSTAAHKFRTRLVFRQHDIILTEEQPLLTKFKSSFEGKNMEAQYSMSDYRIDL